MSAKEQITDFLNKNFFSNTKLRGCSLECVGVYVYLLYILRDSDGEISLQQRDKKTENPVYDFARKLSFSIPCEVNEIESSLVELLDSGVISMQDDRLFQENIVEKKELSRKRSMAANQRWKQESEADVMQNDANLQCKIDANLQCKNDAK